MNILFLVRLWPEFGGGETVTRSLANEFEKRGHNVHVIYFVDSKISNFAMLDDRIVSYRIDNVKCDQNSYDVSMAEFVNQQICNYIRQNSIEIVINQWIPLEYTTSIKIKTSAKVVKCLHTSFYNRISISYRLSKLLKPEIKHGSIFANTIKEVVKILIAPFYEYFLEKKAIQEVEQYFPYIDKYIFLSTQFLNQYLEVSNHYNYKEKVFAISNPLSQKEYYQYEPNSKEKIVLIVGRLEESCKNISRAIKVWANVEKDSKSRFSEWKFQIVGDGSSKLEYETLVSNLNLKKVEFLGFQDPVPYYKNASIFLMTSSLEGFGMTLVEAQCYGVVPIVMDSFLSLHDIITNEENGLIIPNGDISAFTKALFRLMEDNKLWQKLSYKSLQTCKQFDVTTIADKWDILFNELELNKNKYDYTM
ncbi:glycosyltransferase [Bacteroides fragilis]|uniref:glycosyltransferase n=1 Tax=Bacteroides fragilis TaxID=817 RepID=UPI0023669A3E|nr:glycosyltransferase [Bacteroides fragilis]